MDEDYVIDTDSLRDDLIDYFGTAMYNASPLAMMNLSEVENASDMRILELAQENGFDLDDYFK